MRGRTIALGVTGGIAAYKAVELARLLIKEGACVKVMMTEAATRFVSPLTFEAITGNPVATGVFEREPEVGIYHIELGREVDLILIAPATANSIARFACGFADDILSSVVLAADARVAVAPSMNERMYLNSATQRNIDTLRERGFEIIEPAQGALACGEAGIGRLPEPTEIVERVREILSSGPLAGKRFLVTAGGTREAIDPIRFIGNRSSGKMGFEVAHELLRRGGEVILITGPTNLEAPAAARVVTVTTAAEMLDAVLTEFDECDAAVMTAAVADYRPVESSIQKIKKTSDRLVVEMEPTVDILKELSAGRSRQLLVGFAAETENVIENAQKKLADKKIDLLIANDVSRGDAGFEVDTLDAYLIEPGARAEALGIVSKSEIARIIAGKLEKRLLI